MTNTERRAGWDEAIAAVQANGEYQALYALKVERDRRYPPPEPPMPNNDGAETREADAKIAKALIPLLPRLPEYCDRAFIAHGLTRLAHLSRGAARIEEHEADRPDARTEALSAWVVQRDRLVRAMLEAPDA